ncbi:hypothetical protein FQN52_004492 [Onygenales sp. PD_12]|nr:hypothetical protein FQN52_004492 [Onygenales sp. PD_12]
MSSGSNELGLARASLKWTDYVKELASLAVTTGESWGELANDKVGDRQGALQLQEPEGEAGRAVYTPNFWKPGVEAQNEAVVGRRPA